MSISRLNAQTGLKHAFQRIDAEGAKRPRAQAKIYKDVFETLDKSGEIDSSFARQVHQLEEHSVSDTADRHLWSTALAIASELVPGPAGVVLSDDVSRITLRETGRLAKEYGKDAEPLLDSIVPEAWSDGSGDFKGPNGTEKWGLGQARNVIKEGGEESLEALWLVANRVGDKLSTEDLQEARKNETSFLDFYSGLDGWERADGNAADSLHGHQVATRVIGENGKIETVAGLYIAKEPDNYGSAEYTILEQNGNRYEGNSNDDWMLFARTEDPQLSSYKEGIKPPAQGAALSIYGHENNF